MQKKKNIKNLDSNNQSFIEDLLKRDVKVFENFIEEIIKYCGNNEVIQDEQQKIKKSLHSQECFNIKNKQILMKIYY